ncbi:hypothetical protein GA0074692_4362 [Micromonospora pallida]|uniref:Gram-positive cocci surface proteins LPxTG domain-containing protein n=1 Tax=Micromonospora pallida TaxID=145854 RepID=A0A1C6T3X0_9ACTN|nr:hypothetical protein [Micromonospora pallida]SCL36478.1 hypothetical protein GA0074692_4362 [Micromonospora pallida]
MRHKLIRSLTLGVVAAGLLLSAGAPAAAQTTIDIDPGNVPTTAAQYTQNCDPNLGGGPYPDQDVWVFNLPGEPAVSGVFESVTATFTTPDGSLTVTIPDDGGEIVNGMGTSKAWIRLPAGYTLVDATADISGLADFFVLTHTCAAMQPTPTATPTRQPTPTFTPTGQPTPTTTHLPVTGTSSTSTLVPLLALGLGAIVTGGALLSLRRRRS